MLAEPHPLINVLSLLRRAQFGSMEALGDFPKTCVSFARHESPCLRRREAGRYGEAGSTAAGLGERNVAIWGAYTYPLSSAWLQALRRE